MHHEDVKGATGLSFLRPLFSYARIAAMLVLGFASGIPYQLVYITQPAWLYEAKVPIGISNAMAVPLFKSLHYSDTDIATVTKLFGFWVGLA
jgi:PAT family beta-lactamase induction signal transducer AmpG